MYQYNEIIYNKIKNLKVSQTCEIAAKQLFINISPYYTKNKELFHSLIRLSIRPLYYINLNSSTDILNWIEDEFKNSNELNLDFINWLNINPELIKLSLKELKLCNKICDLEFIKKYNYIMLITNNKIFNNFNEYKKYFYICFKKLNISKNEIEKIIV